MAFKPGSAGAPSTKVSISVSCQNLLDRDVLSKSDPMCVLFSKDMADDPYMEIDRTETVKNTLNPEFAYKFVLDYHFELVQRLKFAIYDQDSHSRCLKEHDYLGELECTLGEIVGSPGSKITRNLKFVRSGKITISAKEAGQNRDVIIFQWKAADLEKKSFMGKSDPFLQIYRGNADDNRPIVIECCHWQNNGKHELIGSIETTLLQLSKSLDGVRQKFDLTKPNNNTKNKSAKSSGQLWLVKYVVDTTYTFLDYVRGGMQLHFTVAIDFTISNGDPHDEKSLHFRSPYTPNQYEIALKAVGEIIEDYDHDRFFPALGFGAKVPPHYNVAHEFHLNFSPDPRCHGVRGILDAYAQALQTVQLCTPTNFSPVINHVARIAGTAAPGYHYFILLIITDGEITDMDDTKAAIVEASYLPMSIIIVGVGASKFSAMWYLDADRGLLKTNRFPFRIAERDIVQFVPMSQYTLKGLKSEQSQARLAKDVLAEIPYQVTGYMKKRRIKPLSEAQADAAQFAPTFGQTPHPPPSTVQMPQFNYSHTHGSAPASPRPSYGSVHSPSAPPSPRPEGHDRMYETHRPHTSLGTTPSAPVSSEHNRDYSTHFDSRY